LADREGRVTRAGSLASAASLARASRGVAGLERAPAKARRESLQEKTLRAIVCREFGPPEKLVLEDRPDPTPGPGELVIEAHAATVTFPDALMIEDKYQFKAPLPFVPGGEAAGVVSALGPDVTGFALGERVIGNTMLVGGFAEKVLVRASATRKLAPNMGYAEATGLGYAYGTGYYGLRHRGQLRAGETLLVLGAAGNVGLAAVELGKLFGARVIAAASSPEKLAVCRDRGADEVIDYTREDLKARLKALTAGQGVDVIYDCIGGDYAEAALRSIAWEGRFLVIGFTAGIPKLPLNLTLLKGCQVIGVFYGAMVQRDPALRSEIDRELEALAAAGRLRPYVSERYALADAPKALRALLDRKVTGKVVVEPNR
jgi:NADPH2:quinone reductase